MNSFKLTEQWLRMAAAAAFAVAAALGAPAYAQDEGQPAAGEDQPATEDVAEEAAAEAAREDTIVVTGSRIRRDEFSSASPIQVIDAEESRLSGLVDTAAILQQTTIAQGQQIDNTFAGFVTDNGPGATTISLRGLDAERTLVLINGRRLAPAGVRGAPTRPDLNLIPTSLIERIEVLTDGASSIYGSDAVAGVTNIILRKDVDGIEFDAFQLFTEAGGGRTQQFSVLAGATSDRARIVVAGEYLERGTIFNKDRDFTPCIRDIEFDPSTGKRRVQCQDGFFVNMILDAFDGNPLLDDNFREFRFDFDNGSGFFAPPIAFEPGGPGGLSCPGPNTLPEFDPPIPFDPDVFDDDLCGLTRTADGFTDGIGTDFIFDPRYNTNGEQDDFQLVSPLRRFNVFASGEYDLQRLGNATTYFEASYSNRQQDISIGTGQTFASVPCDNPYIQADPVLSNSTACFLDFLFRNLDPSILFGLPPGTINDGEPFDDLACGTARFPENDPNVPDSLEGDLVLGLPNCFMLTPLLRIKDRFDGGFKTEVEQMRAVLGIRGDLKLGLGWGNNGWLSLTNWTYDVNVNYTRSIGFTSIQQISEERLALSLDTARVDTLDEDDDGDTTEIICGHQETGPDADLFGFLTVSECVPLDVTDPMLYIENRLPPAAAAYLVGASTNRTVIEQSMFQAILQGDVFKLPAGTMPLVVGVEFRDDEIDSQNSFLTTAGVAAGFSQEGNTVGSTSLLEVFFETEIPVLKGLNWAEELTFNVSSRWTEEEHFGALWTYRLQGTYRPVEWLTLRSTYGTTYRAPNLREQFLADQSAFANAFLDPCIPLLGPPTDPVLINNCILQGADPFNLGQGGAPSIPVLTGGADGLEAEKSESLSGGIIFEQPWFDKFDLRVAVTYFDIDVRNSVEEPSAAFILAECLVNNPNLSSPFCERIERNTSADPAQNFISQLDASFLNVGELEAEGLDLNFRFQTDLKFGSEAIALIIDSTTTNMWSQEQNRLGVPDQELGEIGSPRWRNVSDLRLNWRDFTLFWRARYLGGAREDAPDALRVDPVIDNRTGETVFASGFRDVDFVDDVWYHDLSIQYSGSVWLARVGIRNLLDKKPPLVDDGEFTNNGNVPLGVGYDLFGRSYFFDIAAKF